MGYSGGAVVKGPPYAAFSTGGSANLINSSSGSNSVPIIGQTFFAPVLIPYPVPVSGLVVSTANVGGTDLWNVALYPPGGGLPVASSVISGTLAPAANTKVRIPFTTPLMTQGGEYWAALQSNGVTARFLAFPNVTEGFNTAQIPGTFGIWPVLVPPVTYTANIGPFATTYQ